MVASLFETDRYDERSQGDPRPLGGYATLLSAYGTGVVIAAYALRKRRRKMAPFSPMDVVLYALATEHFSRLITKDSVTSVLRRPFSRFEEAAGEGEVNEEVRGRGVRHAIGELMTCPFCIAQWVATGLVVGRMAAPQATSAAVATAALARISDYLQLFYSMARKEA